MAIPSVVGLGTAANGTGNVVPTLPTGWAAGDLHVLVVNNKRSEALSTPSGWTLIGNSVPASGNKVTLFYRTAVGGDTDPTVTDPGDHLYAVIIGFRGGTLAVNNNTASTIEPTNTAVTWPSLTTTYADQIIVNAMATDTDSTGAKFSGAANASLSSVTEQFDNTITSNAGGGLVIVTGGLATAGSTGTTTGTLSTSAIMALMTISVGVAGSAPTSASGSSTGAASVQATGAATVSSAASSAGAGTASGVGAATFAGSGSSAGLAAASGAAASVVAGVGTADGAASAAAVGASVTQPVADIVPSRRGTSITPRNAQRADSDAQEFERSQRESADALRAIIERAFDGEPVPPVATQERAQVIAEVAEAADISGLMLDLADIKQAISAYAKALQDEDDETASMLLLVA